jgi:hypothetical protein
MATKPKTTESQAPLKDASLEAMLAKALAQFDGGDVKGAAAAFAALQEQSLQQDEYRLARTAQRYLDGIRLRQETAAADPAVTPEMGIQVALNRRESEGALAQADAALKAHPDRAGLHYLKAMALAQADKADASAEALAKATSLDPGLLYQFRLEPDFDGVRQAAPFAAFNRG